MTEIYDPPIEWNDAIEAPLILFQQKVLPQWIDEFGHVNHIAYLTIADHADWAFWNWINWPQGTVDSRSGHECVVVEKHACYLRELLLGTPIVLKTQLLDFDDKRYILFQNIWNAREDVLAATVETKLLGFNLNLRRAESWSSTVLERLQKIKHAQALLTFPRAAGEGVSLNQR